jgi:transcription termination/antitermination protein NusG
MPMKLTEFANSPRPQWFALRVKSRFERMVAGAVRGKGFEEFLPLYSSRRRWSDRTKTVEVPLFPGYVFCRLYVEQRLPLLTIPGAMHLVGIGRMPIAIDDAEMAAVQAAVESGLGTEPWPFLNVGQRVQLEAGPLAGLEGILVQVRKQRRLVVSVSLLRRSVAVEIERDWVRPVNVSRRQPASQARPQLKAASASA